MYVFYAWWTLAALLIASSLRQFKACKNIPLQFFTGSILLFVLALGLCHRPYNRDGLWIALVSAFHLGEYFWVRCCHPEKLSFDSFLLNNSRQYTACIIISMLERRCSDWLGISILNIAPDFLAMFTFYFGFFICLSGLILRLAAMFTAGSNFTHLIATRKRDNHIFVHSGVYAFVRHPAYCGWLYWVIGGQILLGNLVCFLLLGYISWNFFDERIAEEEEYLVQFFGESYRAYKTSVPSGIFWIK